MNPKTGEKILFVINPGSGAGNFDWPAAVDSFFADLPVVTEKIFLTPGCSIDRIKDKIKELLPEKVVAVGGDGTVKLVAECLLHTDMAMGILPAGSANGLAKELGIPADTSAALQQLLQNGRKKIHLININKHLCVHLSDIGFNASVIKMFESEKQRGMIGYIRSAWKVLWRHSTMQVTIRIDDQFIRRDAAMVVLANATRYGSGAIINPLGRLDDALFEVVIIKTVSFSEIFKMMVTHRPYNKNKTELYQAQSVTLHSKRKAHFQVDGEYLGKLTHLQASIITEALTIII
jgi:diacylglycerol kinase (ATP)